MDEGNRAMNIIDRIGKKQIDNVLGQRELPEFAPGDTLRVDVKVIEGTRERSVGRVSNRCLHSVRPREYPGELTQCC